MSFPLVSIAQGTELTSGKLNVCANVTESDKKSVAMASQVISASFAAVFYLVMFFQGILVICIERFVRISSSHGTLFVFFVGGLFACINVITTRNNLYVALNFRLFTVSLIGIIFLFFGVTLFSRELPPGENRPTLGRQQPSMGLVVSIITVPLVGIEIVLLIATFNSISTDKINEHLTPVQWLLLKTEKSLFLAQKIFQALFYLCLRKTRIRRDSEEKARFYFRLLSFFNFIEWIDSIVNVERDVRLSGIAKELDGWFNFATVYQALVIDYRLLCSLLFLEHSAEVQNQDGPAEENNYGGNNQDVGLRTCFGYSVGCVCLIAPIFCALYDAGAFNLDARVNTLVITVNLVIVICGGCLLFNNNLDADPIQYRESQGVKIMVSLGNVSFISSNYFSLL